MPRDYTAQPKFDGCWECIVPAYTGIPYLYNMPNNKNAKNSSGTARKNKRAVKPTGRAKVPSRMGGKSTWFRSIASPFGSDAVGIPDDQTSHSGKIISRYSFSGTINALTGTSSNHSFGIILPPYPYFAFLTETSAGNGVLTDLDGTGVAYVAPVSTGPTPIQVPNIASIMGGSSGTNYNGRIRCTSLGVRLSYNGTELNRGGRYTAALIGIGAPCYSVATTGTKLSALSSLVSAPTITKDVFWTYMKERSTARVSDGVFTARWKPSGTPNYQNTSGSTNILAYSVAAGTAAPGGAGVTPCIWSADEGGWGAESGQSALVVIVDGDTTSTAQLGCNAYSIDVEWHWEVIPQETQTVVYPLSMSHYNPVELAVALNGCQSLPVATVTPIANQMTTNF